MGFMDDIKETAEHARHAALERRVEIDQGIDKVAKVADGRTGNKYTKHVTKASNLAHGLVAKLEKD